MINEQLVKSIKAESKKLPNYLNVKVSTGTLNEVIISLGKKDVIYYFNQLSNTLNINDLTIFEEEATDLKYAENEELFNKTVSGLEEIARINSMKAITFTGFVTSYDAQWLDKMGYYIAEGKVGAKGIR